MLTSYFSACWLKTQLGKFSSSHFVLNCLLHFIDFICSIYQFRFFALELVFLFKEFGVLIAVRLRLHNCFVISVAGLLYEIIISQITCFYNLFQMPCSMSLTAFGKQFPKEESWISAGWRRLYGVNGRGLKTWKEVFDEVRKDNESIVSQCGEWFKSPMEIQNQELFTIDKNFQKMLKICKSIDKVEKARTSFNNGREIKGNVREIEHDDVKFRQSKAWSFPVDNLCQFLPPSEIYESALSGIFGGGKWFTEVHIESCGDESVSVTMFGKKNFIYAERGQPTDRPVKSLKSTSRFVHMAVKGPPIEWGDWMYFCLTRKDSLLVQPALVGHVVLTIEGPSFVVGWEAACASDSQRLATASSRYAFGVGTKVQRLFRTLASEEQDVLLPQIPGDCGAVLGREKAVTGAKKMEAQARTKPIFCVSRCPFKRNKKKKCQYCGFMCNFCHKFSSICVTCVGFSAFY